MLEKRYRKRLISISKTMQKGVKERIIPLLIQLEPQYTRDSYAKTLEEAFDNLRNMYKSLDKQAEKLAVEYSKRVDKHNRQKFFENVEKSIGVNLSNVIKSENIEDVLRATNRENVTLIKSIRDEYLKSVENIVFTTVSSGGTSESMITQIAKAGEVSENKAKVIARDQTAKLNSALSRKRSTALGIEEYVWRTSEDDRVRGAHAENNGKVFRYDDPPPTGHPGQDIMCRCIAEPIIKL